LQALKGEFEDLTQRICGDTNENVSLDEKSIEKEKAKRNYVKDESK